MYIQIPQTETARKKEKRPKEGKEKETSISPPPLFPPRAKPRAVCTARNKTSNG